MDLTRVEWRGGMSCEGSSGRAGAGDPSSKWGSSSSICILLSKIEPPPPINHLHALHNVH